MSLSGSCVPHFALFLTVAATTELYTLSLHDALPIWLSDAEPGARHDRAEWVRAVGGYGEPHDGDTHRRRREPPPQRSEEHTSELQSLRHLVCRLLLEKKKRNTTTNERTC